MSTRRKKKNQIEIDLGCLKPQVDWTLVQRVASAGSVVNGHIALQIHSKTHSAMELLMAQLIVEIAQLREAITAQTTSS
jgi:hypothetical protein